MHSGEPLTSKMTTIQAKKEHFTSKFAKLWASAHWAPDSYVYGLSPKYAKVLFMNCKLKDTHNCLNKERMNYQNNGTMVNRLILT